MNISNFQNNKEELPSKKKLYRSLTNREITEKYYKQVLNIWNKIQVKTIKNNQDLYLSFVFNFKFKF